MQTSEPQLFSLLEETPIMSAAIAETPPVVGQPPSPNKRKGTLLIVDDEDDLLTIIYVLFDDWYQAHGIGYLKGIPGAKPEFSDSEVITLLLAMDFIPFPSETQFLGFI